MNKRILVVEDQPDNRQIIRDMLALPTTKSRRPKILDLSRHPCKADTESKWDASTSIHNKLAVAAQDDPKKKFSHRNQLNEATISLTSGFMWKLPDGAMLTRPPASSIARATTGAQVL
jgi:hypothetical protein